VALTFGLVNLGWVVFRSNDLPSALAFAGRLFGIGTVHPGKSLVGGLLYSPYYLACFGAAGMIVWAAPQSWDWTRQISWQRAVVCTGLLWAALAVMVTQAYNPFIYFIF
jgi:alginate O-acetyltransferase complex protein AlgI